MKRNVVLFIFILILSYVTLLKAGDVSVKVNMATSPEGEATTTFSPEADKIYALFQTKDAKRGDKIRAVLIAESVGDAAPPNTKVLEASLDMQGDDGEFDFGKPTDGWPVGKYRVDVYLNDDLVTSAKFTVKPVKKESKGNEEEEEESGD